MKVLIFILTFTSPILSQTYNIYGKVISEYGESLSGVSIFQNGNFMTLTNNKGEYLFYSDIIRNVNITAKLYGYNVKSNQIFITAKDSIYNLDFILDIKSINLNKIEIKAKSINAFSKTDWTILDFAVLDSCIVVLAKVGRKSSIFLFSQNGKLISKNWLNENYNKIEISCLGGVHLVGKMICSEIKIIKRKVVFIEKYSRKNFNDLLANCCVTYDSISIFKELSKHNKMIVYYYFDKKIKKSKKIIKIFDEKAFRFAKSQYNRIIKEYYKTIASPGVNEINADFPAYNIIEEGEWDGDLTQLMISNELIKMIGFYRFVLSHPLKSKILNISKKLYVFDFINNQIININLDGDIIAKLSISLDKCSDLIVLKDDKLPNVYLICNHNRVFSLDMNNGITNLVYTFNNIRFPEDFSVHNDCIYFKSYDIASSRYTKLHRVKLY